MVVAVVDLVDSDPDTPQRPEIIDLISSGKDESPGITPIRSLKKRRYRTPSKPLRECSSVLDASIDSSPESLHDRHGPLFPLSPLCKRSPRIDLPQDSGNSLDESVSTSLAFAMSSDDTSPEPHSLAETCEDAPTALPQNSLSEKKGRSSPRKHSSRPSSGDKVAKLKVNRKDAAAELVCDYCCDDELAQLLKGLFKEYSIVGFPKEHTLPQGCACLIDVHRQADNVYDDNLECYVKNTERLESERYVIAVVDAGEAGVLDDVDKTTEYFQGLESIYPDNSYCYIIEGYDKYAKKQAHRNSVLAFDQMHAQVVLEVKLGLKVIYTSDVQGTVTWVENLLLDVASRRYTNKSFTQGLLNHKISRNEPQLMKILLNQIDFLRKQEVEALARSHNSVSQVYQALESDNDLGGYGAALRQLLISRNPNEVIDR